MDVITCVAGSSSYLYSYSPFLSVKIVVTTPFESTVLKRAGLAEFQRIIREEDPPRPSTRISALAELRSRQQRPSATPADAATVAGSF